MIPRARKYAHKIAWEEARRRDVVSLSLRRAAGIGKRVITSAYRNPDYFVHLYYLSDVLTVRVGSSAS